MTDTKNKRDIIFIVYVELKQSKTGIKSEKASQVHVRFSQPRLLGDQGSSEGMDDLGNLAYSILGGDIDK